MSAPHFYNPATVAPPIGAYSHVAVVPPESTLLYLAGQVGNRPDGSVPEALEDQYEQAFKNIAAILEAHGAEPSDIVKINTYLVSMPSAEKMKGVRQAVLGDIKPAATLVYVPRLADQKFQVEVEVVAVKRL